MSSCNPTWLAEGPDTLQPGILYGVLPGGHFLSPPVGDTLRLTVGIGDCFSPGQPLELAPGEGLSLTAPPEDTLYLRVDSGGGPLPIVLCAINVGNFCAYVFRRPCGPGGGWPSAFPPVLLDELWWGMWDGTAGAEMRKGCLCKPRTFGDKEFCADIGECQSGLDYTSCGRELLRVCRSGGLWIGLAPYLPQNIPGGGCATWEGCIHVDVLYQPKGRTDTLLIEKCLVGALGCGYCTAADTAASPCTGIAVSRDVCNGRLFYWLPPCPPPGRYWGEPFTLTGSRGSGVVVEVVDTRVEWLGSLPSVGCVGDTVQLCAVVGAGASVASYTWTINGQNFTSPGPLPGPDSAIVCTTLVLPSAGPVEVTFSAQHDTSIFCTDCCAPPAIRGESRYGCDACFSVTHTLRVEEASCVLVATPETICVGEPVFFQLSSAVCAGGAAAIAFTPNLGVAPPIRVSGPTWSYTYLSAGSYRSAVLVITGRGDTVFCTARVQVRAKPYVWLTGPSQMCWNGAQPTACVATAGPLSTTQALYCAGGDAFTADSVVWSLSCGGRSPIYSISGALLTVQDWGPGRGNCTICVTAWKDGCAGQSCLEVEDNRTHHGAYLRGPQVTCVDNVGGAVYQLVDVAGQPWMPPAGVTVTWLLPAGATYTATPTQVSISSWGPAQSTGALLQAILMGEAGCRDTLAFWVSPCCRPSDPTALVYVRKRVSEILQADPQAFTCRTFGVQDTLWVDTTVRWTNCHVLLGRGATIVLNRPRVQLHLVSQPGACAIGGTRLEPCDTTWRGIYEGHDAVAVVVEGYKKEPGVWGAVWIIGADTAIWMERGGGTWSVRYGFFNRCGVALYKGGPSLSDCKVHQAVFTWAEAPELGTPTAPTYLVRPAGRRTWQPVSSRTIPAAVGIWLEKPTHVRRERFVGWGDPDQVYFRYLDYGVLSIGVPVHLRGGYYERIIERECRGVEIAQDARILSFPDKAVIACPTPFECPLGTGVCSQAFPAVTRELDAWGRDSVEVLAGRFDTVSYGVWVASHFKKAVREDRHLRGVRIEEGVFQENKQAITLWGVGATPVSWDLSVSVQRNLGNRAGYGALLQVGRVYGELRYNTFSSSAGRAGLYVAGRYTYNGKGVLTISDNVLSGFRWGIRYVEGTGPLDVIGNQIAVPLRARAVGISVVPLGLARVWVQGNSVSGRLPTTRLGCYTHECEFCVRRGIEVSPTSVATPVEVCGNTVRWVEQSYHFGEHFSGCQWRNNISQRLQTTPTTLDLYLSGKFSQVLSAGGPPPWRGNNRGIGSPALLRWGAEVDRLGVKFYEPPRSSISKFCSGGWQIISAYRVRPCPMRGQVGGPVLRVDTALVGEVVRQGGSAAQLWGALRTVELDTTGTILASDTVLPPFYSWAQGRPMGPLESAYQRLWRERRVSPSLGSPPTDRAEFTAFQTVPLLEKVLQGESLTEAERDTLIAVALRCPTTGGPLVHAARTAVELLRGELLYPEACAEEGAEAPQARYSPASPSQQATSALASKEGPKRMPYLRLLPNPADIVVLVEWGGVEGAGEVAVQDMLGRELVRWATMGPGQRRIVVADWPRGVYRITYRSEQAFRSQNLLLR